MVRKVNKGVSLVEVLIALAIFSVMMIPIVNALITGMKTTTTGKEVQNRNEYAQNLMESMKEMPIDVLNSSDESYFKKMGATGVSITHTEDTTTYVKNNADGTTTPCPYDVYTIKGTTYLGVERTEYSYLIEMSSAPYAEAQALGSMNPNNVTSGVVEDLDQSKVALISAALANYDTPARDALLTKKMSKLREKQEASGGTYDPVKDVEKFKNDTGNRIINIEVKGDASNGYDVICTLYYSDNCTYLSIGREIGMVEYTPYQKHFDKLPNIYLMYNVGVYNEQYTNDYITYDISGVDEAAEVNVFVVETAANYSKDVVATNNASGENLLKGDATGLYRKANGNTRDSASIGMALLNQGLTDTKKKNFHVYHNMFAPSRNDYDTDADYLTAMAEWNNRNSKNVDVKYNDAVAGAVRALFHDSTHLYVGVPSVGNLNQALSGARGLYEVKIWMQEGALDEEAIKKPGPVLQGTRGGGEID